ncbi:MAG: ROK family protein, partial [Aggregatilineales bacterium]
MTDEIIIGVDLGGTRIRAACLDEKLNLLERRETLTKADGGLDATLDRIKSLIHEVMPDDKTVRGIGISAPGPLNPETGVVVAPPNLAGWHNVPLGDILHDEFDVPVYVGNDANVAALAEVTRGAAKGYRHAIYITVSTGVGSGIIYDGRLLLGREGLAGEAGHMMIVSDDERISSVEKEAAGPWLVKHLKKRLNKGATSQVLKLADNDIEKIDAKLIGQAANNGDVLAIE